MAKHFPRGHSLHKLFNKNNVKLSYSCTNNIRSIITNHNSKVLKQTSDAPETPNRTCNYRIKPNCPLNGNCLASNLIYRAEVTSSSPTKSYIGLSGGSFKHRYNNHTKSFRNERYEKDTELSKCIWNLKRRGEIFFIKWNILKQSNTRIRKSGQCNLCLDEKLCILLAKNCNSLNKRSELISKCRHTNHAKLKQPVISPTLA